MKIILKKCILIMICTMIVLLKIPVLKTSAESTDTEYNNYIPVHIAIVMDASGSVNSPTESNPSDPELFSRVAAESVVDYLQAYGGNEVALFEYSDKCTMKMGLTSVDKTSNQEALKEGLESMTDCKGATHMIDAIKNAREYLEDNHVSGVTDAIFVFTDGAEDSNRINSRTATDSLIEQEVSRAIGGSKVRVYSIALDYIDDSGKNSIENGGYGKQILDLFASKTNGEVFVVEKNNAHLETSFYKALEDLLNIKDPDPVPIKDHEAKLDVHDFCVEALIRIESIDNNELNENNLELYEPDSNAPVDLTDKSDDSKIYFSKNRLGATIRIRGPKSGRWILKLADSINEDDVKISEILQINMSLRTTISQTEKNNVGDGIHISTVMVNQDKDMTDPYYYSDITTATAIVSEDPNADLTKMSVEEILDSGNAEMYDMYAEGGSFAFSYVPEKQGVYSINVLVHNEYFDICGRERLTVGDDMSQTGSLEDIIVENGDTYQKTDVGSLVTSPLAKCSVTSCSDDICSVELKDDVLTVKGISPGKGEIELTFVSPGGNVVIPVSCDVTVTNCPPSVNIEKSVIQIYSDETALSDIFSKGIEDRENDPITCEVASISGDSVSDVEFNGTVLSLKGEEPGLTDIEVMISDGENVITHNLRVEVVKKPIPVTVWVIAAVSAVLIAFVLILVILTKRSKLNTNLRDIYVAISENVEIEGQNIRKLSDGLLLSELTGNRSKANLYSILNSFINKAEPDQGVNISSYREGYDVLKKSLEIRNLKMRLERVSIKGSASSDKPDKVTISDNEITYRKTNADGISNEADTSRRYTFKLNNLSETHELVFRFLDEGQFRFFMIRMSGETLGGMGSETDDDHDGFELEEDVDLGGSFDDDLDLEDDGFVFDTDDDF